MNDTTLQTPAGLIAELLFAKSPAFVPESDLATAGGVSGYAARWYVFQLRQAGYVIEACANVDREAFANGVRGWRLVDVRPAARVIANVTCAPANVPESVTARKGLKVSHPQHGEGRVTFVRAGFPKIAVEFGGHGPGRKINVSVDEIFAVLKRGALALVTEATL